MLKETFLESGDRVNERERRGEEESFNRSSTMIHYHDEVGRVFLVICRKSVKRNLPSVIRDNYNLQTFKHPNG